MIDLHVHVHTGNKMDISRLPKYYQDTLNSKLYSSLAAAGDLIPKSTLRKAAWILGVYFKNQDLLGKITPVQKVLINGLVRTLEATPLEKLLESMDKNSIKKAVIQVVEPYMNTNYALEMKKNNPRLYVFGSVKFCRDDYAMQAEATGKKDIDGFKVHPPLQMLPPDSHKIIEAIEALPANLPVLLDTGPFLGFSIGTDINKLENLLKNNKHRTVILAHIGKGHYENAINLAKRYDKVCLETSMQPAKVIRKAIDAIGPERIFLGSDFPILGQRVAINQLQKATNDNEFELISRLNAEKLLSKRK